MQVRAQCFNAHETMINTGARWCVRNEMFRRRGSEQDRRVSPSVSDVTARVVRVSNVRTPGLQSEKGKRQAGSAKTPPAVITEDRPRISDATGSPIRETGTVYNNFPRARLRVIHRRSVATKWHISEINSSAPMAIGRVENRVKKTADIARR